MSNGKKNSEKKSSEIQCVEVLVSKKYLHDTRNNLGWKLSVYSLENKPVTKDRALCNSEIFHFMLYDWKKTVKQLLDDFQVPYAIIQYFSPDTIHADGLSGGYFLSDNETDFLLALDELETIEKIPTAATGRLHNESHNLILDHSR